MKYIRIALRNLNRQKKRSILLGGAIAFGIMIVTIINGFTGSFIENVGENFSHILAGHIFVEGLEKSPTGRRLQVLRDDEPLREALDELDLDVEYITKRSEFRGTIIFQGNSIQQNITGIDWSAEKYVQERLIIREGSFEETMKNPRGIILVDKVVDKLKLQLGDRMLVKMRTITGQQNVGEFTLTAVSADPGLLGGISAYTSLQYTAELLNLGPGEYMTMGIFLRRFGEIDSAAEKLYSYLKPRTNIFERDDLQGEDSPIRALMNQTEDQEWEGSRYILYTLNDILAEVQQIVDVLNNASIIILLVLFLIIMVGVTNTFRMVMFERIKEIGTIRALGMQREGVRNLFLYEAMFLCLGGAVSGLVLAGLIMFGLSNYFWGVDSAIFILLKNGYMTFKVAWYQVVMNISIVAALTLLAAYLPARKAALMPPVQALGTHK